MRNRRQFKVFLIGDGPLLTECGRLLLENGHEIVAVATGNIEVELWARNHSVKCDIDMSDPHNPIRTADYDILLSIANLHIIPAAVLERARIAAINFHDGPLTHYSGVFVTSWCIINGEKEHGVTWHFMDAKADNGDIILQRSFPLSSSETANSLNSKCFDAGLESFEDLLKGLETGLVTGAPQERAVRRVFRRWQKPIGCAVIDGRSPAEDIDCLVRGLAFGDRPNPLLAAKLYSGRSWVSVTEARILEGESKEIAGTLLPATGDCIRIATTTSDVEFGRLVTPDGRRVTAAEALDHLGLNVGLALSVMPGDAGLDRLQRDVARNESYWESCFEQCNPVDLAALNSGSVESCRNPASRRLVFDISSRSAPVSGDAMDIAAAWVAFACRLSGSLDFDIGFSSEKMRRQFGRFDAFFSLALPMHFALESDDTPRELQRMLLDNIDQAESRGTFFSDLAVRRPGWPAERRAGIARSLPVGLDIATDPAEFDPERLPGEITLRVGEKGSAAIVCKQGPAENYVDRVAEIFVDFLGALRTNRDTAVGRIPLASRDSSSEISIASKGPAVEFDARSGVLGLIDFHAEGIAIRCGADRHSYPEIARHSEDIGRRLIGLGVRQGDIVGVHMNRTADMVCTLLGIWKAGAAYLPLDPEFPADLLDYMIEDSGAAYLATDKILAGKLDGGDLKVLVVDEELTGIERPELPELGDVSGQIAYVLYTSGSTGKPKGVLVPQSALVNFLTSMTVEPGLSRSDRLLAVTTTSFDISALELFLPLAVGAEVVIAGREDSRDGSKLRDLLHSCGATVMQATPSTWRMLLESNWTGGRDFTVLCGGESFPPDLARSLLERCGQVWNMYGPTETTIWSTCVQLQDAESRITIGRPIANTQVYVFNEYGSPQPVGVPGELYIGGEGVAVGYINRPRLTEQRFVDDPFTEGRGRLYRTGDSVRLQADGTLEYLGRIDSQVKVRGFRIDLGEIESVLNEHESVLRTAAHVWDLGPGDQRLVAYVVLTPGQRLATTELRKHLRAKMPYYMVPQHYVALADIPLTPNGKVDRSRLPMPAAGPEDGRVDKQMPETETEKIVAGVWSGLLAVDNIGRYDNFFELGGHSLLAVKAIVELEKVTGTRLEFRHIVMDNLLGVSRNLNPHGNANQKKSRLRSMLAGIKSRPGTDTELE